MEEEYGSNFALRHTLESTKTSNRILITYPEIQVSMTGATPIAKVDKRDKNNTNDYNKFDPI